MPIFAGQNGTDGQDSTTPAPPNCTIRSDLNPMISGEGYADDNKSPLQSLDGCKAAHLLMILDWAVLDQKQRKEKNC
jgi:hypothetical protein